MNQHKITILNNFRKCFKYTFIKCLNTHLSLTSIITKNACLLVAFYFFSRSWSIGRLCVYWLILQFLEIPGPHAAGSVSVLTELYIWSAVSILAVMHLLSRRPRQNTRTTSIQSQRINPNTCSFPASSGGRPGCRSGERASESLSSSLYKSLSLFFYGFSESCRERNSLLILDLAEGKGRWRELSLAFPPCFLLSEKGF